MSRGEKIVKVDKITGEVLAVYSGIAEAMRNNQDALAYYGIHNMARYKSLGYMGFVFRYESLYDPHESFIGKRGNVPVEVIYSGKRYYYSNIAAAAKALGCHYSTVSHALRNNTTVYGAKVRRLRFMGDIMPNGIKAKERGNR